MPERRTQLIEDLMKLAEEISIAEADLETSVATYNTALAKFREDQAVTIATVRAQATGLSLLKTMLDQTIDENRGLFVKPKRRTVNSVTFGLQKGKGKVSWKISDTLLVKRIRRLLPRKSKQLIKTTEKPIKASLSKLKGDILKKLGINITGTGDAPFIKFEDTDAEAAAKAVLELDEAGK